MYFSMDSPFIFGKRRCLEETFLALEPMEDGHFPCVLSSLQALNSLSYQEGLTLSDWKISLRSQLHGLAQKDALKAERICQKLLFYRGTADEKAQLQELGVSMPSRCPLKGHLLGGMETKQRGVVPEMAFGAQKWGLYFGDVGEEPPLPDNILEILSLPCPFWSDRRVMDTHILVLVPSKINGHPLTLDLLRELVQYPQGGGYGTKCGDYYDEYVKPALGSFSFPESHWILMTRDILPWSWDNNYVDQCALVQKYAKWTGIGYALPQALDAAVGILMHYVDTGERLYGDGHTRCQEKVNNNQYPVVIGKFGSNGLYISNGLHFFRSHCGGVCAVWKFEEI